MSSTREYNTYQEFEREELRAYRNNAWSITDLIEDFQTEDLDLNLIEGDEERDEADDDDD